MKEKRCLLYINETTTINETKKNKTYCYPGMGMININVIDWNTITLSFIRLN